MPTSGATVDKKNGVLELIKLEYPKWWQMPNYFANSAIGPNISTIDANGPFWPFFYTIKVPQGTEWEKSENFDSKLLNEIFDTIKRG